MRNKAKGFTLIEILVVLGIIALLTTLSMVAVRYARDRARAAKAQNEVDQILLAVSMLANDTGLWPGHQAAGQAGAAANNEICDAADQGGNGCAAQLTDAVSGLVSDDGANPYSGWAGPYMPDIPEDPWGYEYFFDTDYQVDMDDRPCGCGNLPCVPAVVVGSYGPDMLGIPDENNGTPGSYGCDDIIKIITK